MNIVTRRTVLTGIGAIGAGAIAGCGSSGSSGKTSSSPSLVSPSGAEVQRKERRRRNSGREQKVTLTATAAKLELGAGVRPSTWAFGQRTPGQPIRISAGDTLVAAVPNKLPSGTATSIHWHGVALRNDMDGVAGVTQQAVASGETFTYRFTAPDPGTYFFHPHVGVQLDRGL
ncbi:MAG: multicopper oxidase domain-containing protein, partial [Catenulispora sp.]|nr:multicopper oxidase domain-containing protein [Catenulispora sp.]